MGRTASITRLNQKQIDQLKPKKSRYYVWLNDPRGFGVSIQPGGSKTFVFRYTNELNKERFLSLGATDVVPLEKARKRCLILAGGVAEGIDPVAEQNKEIEEQKRQMPFGEFWEMYLDDAKQRLKPRTIVDIEATWKNYLKKRFEKRPLIEITRSEIATMHRAMSSTPTSANRTLAYLRASLSSAIEWGLLESEINPATRIRPYPEKAREFRLSEKQWPLLMNAIDELEEIGVDEKFRANNGRYTSAARGLNPFAAALFRLIIYTGMRRGEAMALKWTEVDWDNEILNLEDSKTGRRVVFCGPKCFEVLKSIHSIRTQEVWVFEGNKANSHIVEPKSAVKRILEKSEIPGLTLHGIRHAVASHLAELGFPETPIIQGILGHRQKSVTGRYVHAARKIYQEAIKAHEDAIGESVIASKQVKNEEHK